MQFSVIAPVDDCQRLPSLAHEMIDGE